MKLLIAVDGQAHSRPALELGSVLALAASTQPTLISVARREAERSLAEEILSRAVAKLPQAQRGCPQIIAVGKPREQIVLHAYQGGYDPIILGMHPIRRLGKRLREPTSEWVLKHGPSSVIIAKGQPVLPRHILICDSGADSFNLVEQFRHHFAGWLPQETRVTILHVMSQISAGPGVDGWELQANAEQLIQDDTPEGYALKTDEQLLEQSHMDTRVIVRHGLVVEEILAEAGSSAYDLMLIGEHMNGSWQRLLLDNIAHEILSASGCSIMIAKRMPVQK